MITLKNGMEIEIRTYIEADFSSIHALNEQEQWTNLVVKKEETKNAWKHSNVAFVATLDNQIIGYVRGMTDHSITLYICELLIEQAYRGMGLGHNLLNYVHCLYPTTRVEMLASSTSHSYYESQGFRPFYGFRKTLVEW